MTSRTTVVLMLLTLGGLLAQIAVLAGYPSGYSELAAAGMREGRVVIYATTDTRLVTQLIREFQTAYGIQVDYHDLNSTEVYARFVSETAAGKPSADVLWSSAMDLQVKLVNDGYALPYRSPEIPNLPDWAYWRDEAYGTTFEPIAIVYNKNLLREHEVPRTHTEFLDLLKANRARFRNKVTTYDPERSGLGFMLFTQDGKLNPGFWGLIKAMGDCAVKLESNTAAMLERISTGENLIGYNMLGSYALARAKRDPALGIVLTEDYTLIISRLMFVSKSARHPNAGKLWLDFVLSQRGQKILVERAELYSVRKDMNDNASEAVLARRLGEAVKPVTVGPGLLAYLDQAKRRSFLRQWHESLGRAGSTGRK
jgi:iron(III) transport system substrate-binding protein